MSTESTTKSLNIAVAEKIAAAGPAIQNRVIDRFADVEIGRRADALYKAVEISERLLKDLAKINRPDAVTRNRDGSVATETYTDARLKEIKKVEEKIAKVEKAVAAATAEKPDWSPLLNLKVDDNAGSNPPASE